MSRAASAVPSRLSSFAVASLVESRTRDRLTGLRAGPVTVAGVASWVASGVAEPDDRRATAADAGPAKSTAGSV
ncbi:hypothetical protein [Halorussus sp. AFM4]|uniref:hypothetical protein n=1 Tax=Halorussus sp. AFM4 TaxID=3421651 RepID=UPI003EBC39B2